MSRKATNEYTCKYDKSQTIKEALQRRKSKINGIKLYHKLLKILHCIRKVQELSKQSIPESGLSHPIPWTTTTTRKCPAFDELGNITNQHRVFILFDKLGDLGHTQVRDRQQKRKLP